MKANSCGLEIAIELSGDEINFLGNGQKLESILNFASPFSSEERKIPFSLNYVPSNPDDLDIQSTPEEDYLGDADSIAVTINEDFYIGLLNNDYYAQRFGLGGRVDISKSKS